MKRVFITLLVLIAILAGGGYFLFLEILKPGDVPAKVLNAEEAIASKGTIAIASIDMSHVRRIDEMFKGIKDPSPLIISKDVKPAETFLENLKKQGINLVSKTDYGLAAINIGQDKPAYTIVLFGRYSQNNLKKAIRKSHLVEESANGVWLITSLAEVQKKTDPCAAPNKQLSLKQQALHIQNDRILLSSPEMMPVILKRFSSKARAGVTLTKWRAFRKDKVVAGAFMSPKKAKKGAIDLPSALLLGAISKQPLVDIYAGAEVSLLPSPGFKVAIDAHSNDAAWVLDVKTKFDTWLAEVMTDVEKMPILASVFKTLNLQADGNVLRFKTIANRTTLDNLEKIPSEFFQVVLSNMSFGDGAGEIGKEQIIKEEDLKKYTSRFDFSTVDAFDSKGSLYKSDRIVGPFGIRLKKIGLLAADHSVVELKISAEGKGFENIFDEFIHKSDEFPSASLVITSVEDKEGNNLLREELCGKNRNLIPTSLSVSRDKEYVDGTWISKSLKVSGEKSIRLKQLVLLSQVANIKGKVIIRAATQTSIKKLKMPFAKKIIENKNVRMYFKKSNAGTVKYDLSGDISRIMAVRAKNAKGEYLAGRSSSASNYGGVKTVSKHFKGIVASIEVVVAEQVKNKEYPFEINKIAPRYGIKGGKQISMILTSKKRFLRQYAKVKYKNECKEKQKVRAGAFLICLNKFGKQMGTAVGGEFEVIGPAEDALQNDLSAGVLSIDSVKTGSGKKILFDKKVAVDFNYKFDTNYNEKNKEWQITNRRLQAYYVKISADVKELNDETVKVINGTLTIRIPKKPKYIELGADELGVIKKSKDGITANIAGFEDWNTYIDIQGSASKIMRFMPIARNEAVLNTGNDRINEKQYNTWGMSEEDKEKIKALPKKWQGMITIRSA